MNPILIAILLTTLVPGSSQDSGSWVEVSYDGVARGRVVAAAEPHFDGASVAVPVFDVSDRPHIGDVAVSAFELRAWEECDAVRILVFARLPANSNPGTVRGSVLNRRRLVATVRLEKAGVPSEITLTDVRGARSFAVRLVEK